MIINKLRYMMFLSAVLVMTLTLTPIHSHAEIDTKVIQLNPNFGKPIRLPENAATIAIGDPNIADVVTVEPNLLMITGQKNGSTSMTVIGQSGEIYQYTLLVANDVTQLKTLISSVGPNVVVESIKGRILLRGTVETAAQLSRVLTIADRYMGGKGSTPSFNVISDQGGVLAGNLNSARVQRINPISTGGGGGGGRQGGAARGGQNGGGASTQPISSDGKANLAQNISRASVVSVANGKVISMIKVINQPKVEIQMRIVEVDRSKTDEFGIDWRLDGNNVTIGSFAGDVTSTLPSPSSTTPVNKDSANLLGFFTPGRYTLSTFVRALEEKGATTTLSEPLLTAISGEATNFLVGGSVPIPTQTQTSSFNNVATATNVQFMNFGLAITVRPTVLENGNINIVLDQSMSSLDYGRAIQILGSDVPAFNQKTISTVTESASGETWAVAGLLTEEDRKRLQSVPWVSKVPVLGKIFRNNNDSTTRNELIILVNARRVDSINSTTTNFSGRGNFDPYSNNRNINPTGNELDSNLPAGSKKLKNNSQSVDKNIRSIEIKRQPISTSEAKSQSGYFKDMPSWKHSKKNRYEYASTVTKKELNSKISRSDKVTIIHLKNKIESTKVNNVAQLDWGKQKRVTNKQINNKSQRLVIRSDEIKSSQKYNKTISRDLKNVKSSRLTILDQKSNLNSLLTNIRGVPIKAASLTKSLLNIVVHNFLVGHEKTAFINKLKYSDDLHDISNWRVASGSYVDNPDKEVIFVIKPKYNKKVYSGALVKVDTTHKGDYLFAVNHSNT